MLRRILRQVALAAVQLVIVSLFVFALLNAAPGDAAESVAGEGATQERVGEVRDQLGLDDPFLTQYGSWFKDAVSLDLGASLTTHEEVTSILARTIPPTMSLIGLALVVSVVIALVAGTAAALKAGGWIDRAVTALSGLAVAVPGFWLALMLVSLFAVNNQWLPAVGYTPFADSPVEWLRHLILPALALSAVTAAELTRQLRGSLLDALQTEYVLAARAKGMPQRKLVFKHALKNALIPMLTVLGVRISQLVGGTVVIESIFNINGVGSTVVRATIVRDITVVLGVTALTAVVVMATNILIQLCHPFFNPKLRSQ